LLELILRLLDNCAEPVVGAAELGRYPAEQLTELLGAGILRETCRATEIPRPGRYGSAADLIVRETALGLFGVAEEDDYHDPIALTAEEVRQYSVSVPALITEIRRRNGIPGGSVKAEGGLFLVGMKQIEGVTRFPVYLSLPNLGEEELLERCLRAKRGVKGAIALVLVPGEPNVSAPVQRMLDESGVRIFALSGSGGRAGLTVDWVAIGRSLSGRSVEPERYVFRKKGQVWEVAFEGPWVMVPDSKGLRYLAELLRDPGREVMAVELFAAARGIENVPVGSTGELIDAKARREYERRAEDLKAQLEEAERYHDLGRKERIHEELDQLAEQILAARGLSGRGRQAQDDRDRIRKSVSAAIRRAIQSIRQQAPPVAAHLEQHIKQGYFLSYTGSIPWKF
jgi:hypothetical protein